MEQVPMHESLERDIVELSGKIEGSGIEARKESLKNAIGEKIYEDTKEGPKTETPIPNPQSPLPGYAQNEPEDARLRGEKLVDLAWHKGLVAAINEAKKSDPLTMDIFHDAITEKLYEEFKKRKIIS